MKYIQFDRQKYRQFVKIYDAAVADGKSSFTFDGDEYAVNYGKYVIEYLEGKFGKTPVKKATYINPRKKLHFSRQTRWVRQDGWRGYNEPVYAVCGANDTGSWGDSPCPHDVCIRELKEAATALKMPYRMMVTQTSNVFCIHRYVIVPVDRVDEARELFAAYYATVRGDTKLLYPVDAEPTKPKTQAEQHDEMKTIATIASIGDLFGDTTKEKNDWKARMLRAGLEGHGLIMPDDWDSLPETEKTKRLDAIIAMLKE
jgi:hypothetical protein